MSETLCKKRGALIGNIKKVRELEKIFYFILKER